MLFLQSLILYSSIIDSAFVSLLSSVLIYLLAPLITLERQLRNISNKFDLKMHKCRKSQIAENQQNGPGRDRILTDAYGQNVGDNFI